MDVERPPHTGCLLKDAEVLYKLTDDDYLQIVKRC